MAKRKEVIQSLLKANSTNIEWHGFPIWDVLRNDQKEELDKGRLTLIIIIKVSRFYSASRHVFTPTFIHYLLIGKFRGIFKETYKVSETV